MFVCSLGEQELELCNAYEVLVQPKQMAYCNDTYDGSLAYVALYNGNSNSIKLSVTLGLDSWVTELKAKETKYYPKGGPGNFNGKPLYISNLSISEEKTSVLTVVLFSNSCDSLNMEIKSN